MTLQISRDGAAVVNEDALSGSPAVRITGDNVRLTNGGSLDSTSAAVGAVVIQGNGVKLVNEAGGEIAAAAADGVAVLGSSGADFITDAGSGNDWFTSLTGSPDAVIDLGGGNDVYRHGSTSYVGAVAGGAGYDRMILTAYNWNMMGFDSSGFEQLEVTVGDSSWNLQGFSGYQKVVVTPGAHVAFRHSDNPDADIGFAAGSGWSFLRILYAATFRNIVGTESGETIEVSTGTVLGDVDLLGGDDAFNYFDLSWQSVTSTIGGTVDGGAGYDRLYLAVDHGGTLDLGWITGFESIDTGLFSSTISNLRLVGADGYDFIAVDHLGGLTLAESDSPGATISLTFPSMLVLEATATVGRVGEHLTGVAEAENGDDSKSVRVVNRGTILGDVLLNVGDDLFDGRSGTVGGTISGFAGHDRLTGGLGDDAIEGGWGNDLLDGGPGGDLLSGGEGHDSYVVDNRLDRVVELGSAGNDTVRSSVDFVLPTHVEKLVLTGTAAIDGRGNSGANAITGNSRGNFLNGNRGDDAIDGGGGNDRILGAAGNDVLKGGAGLDRFEFTSALGADNVDRILDFSSADDSLHLMRSVFSKAGANGTLGAAAFHLGSAAADAGDRILYDSATGNIFYDADGTGAGTALLFATVDAGAVLTHADFVIYG
jgi:Ca2+-binding RTX toxin-like protein